MKANIVSQLKSNCSVFLNNKLISVPTEKLEYYIIMREIYVKIIGKWNSSVSNVFIDGFKLKTEGRERIISKAEFYTFLTQNMKIDLRSIDTDTL